MHRTPYPIDGLSVELAEVFGAQQLQEAADAAERRLQVVRGDVSELLQLDIAAYQSVVGALQGFRLRGALRRALGHALLEQFVGLAQRLLQLLAFGMRPISIGNSLPSLRRPNRSRLPPLRRASVAMKNWPRRPVWAAPKRMVSIF